MTGQLKGTRSAFKKGAISRWWSGALLAAGVAMTFGAASCGGSSGGPPLFVRGDGVWVADPFPNSESGAPQIDEFTTDQFRNGVPNPKPRKIITNGGTDTVPGFDVPQDTLFDSSGNLWVIDGGDVADEVPAAIFKFTAAQLKGNGEITPAFFLTSEESLVFPEFAVFDGGGNLWVSDLGADQIFEFTAEQLTTTPPGGDQVPALSLTDSTDDNPLGGPIGMVFDATGNLWVADNTNSQLLKFNHSTLANLTPNTENDVPADASIQSVSTDTADSLANPFGLSFDGSENLWVTNEELPAAQPTGTALKSNAAKAPQQAQAVATDGQGTLVEFAAADVSAATPGSAPTPAAIVLPADVDDSVSLDDPVGVSVDVKRGLVILANF